MKRFYFAILVIGISVNVFAQEGKAVMEKVFDNFERNYIGGKVYMNANLLMERKSNDSVLYLVNNSGCWAFPPVEKKQKPKRIGIEGNNFNTSLKVAKVRPDVVRDLYSDYLRKGDKAFKDLEFLPLVENEDEFVVETVSENGRYKVKKSYYVNKSDYAVNRMVLQSLTEEKKKKPNLLFPIKERTLKYCMEHKYEKIDGKYVVVSMKWKTEKEKAYLAKPNVPDKVVVSGYVYSKVDTKKGTEVFSGKVKKSLTRVQAASLVEECRDR